MGLIQKTETETELDVVGCRLCRVMGYALQGVDRTPTEDRTWRKEGKFAPESKH